MSTAPDNHDSVAWSTTATYGSQTGSDPRVPNGFGTPAASQAGSASAAASHARVAQDDIENVGWRASQTNLSASQRAETVQREMAARLEHIAAPLDGALPLGAANHNPTHIGEGMLDDLEELYQEAKAAKK